MNILNKVTLKGLLKNKTRTVVTIIGIILSTAMICAVTTFASSLRNLMAESAEYEEGRWYGRSQNISAEESRRVLSLQEISEKGLCQKLGYAEIEGSQNEYKPYLKVIGADQGFFDLTPVHLTSGRLPENPGEILIPRHLDANGGIVLQEGDTLTLSLGERILIEDGEPCGEFSYRAFGEETIAVRDTREYTVVGFYGRFPYALEKYNDPGYTAITYIEQTARDAYVYDVYFRLPNANDVYSFIRQNELVNAETNSQYLTYLGSSRYSSFYAVLYSLMAIVIAIIMLGSVSLIYNAFSISVSERTKQFGLLSSLGATKKQLRSMVFSEAFWLSLIGIPVGIVSGIAGIGVTLYFMKDTFASMLGETFGAVTLKLSVSWISVALAVVIALFTVLISAWIPSRRAQKVSAIEAIRQSSDIKTRAKDVKTSRLTYRFFGLEGLLAKKHFKRNRKKYRSTVLSLALSIILFISASAFGDELVASIGIGYSTRDYSLLYSYGGEEEETGEEIYPLLKQAKGVTDSASFLSYLSYTAVKTSEISGDYRKALEEEWAHIKKNYGNESLAENPLDEPYQFFSAPVFFLDDEAYEAYLSKNKISRDSLTAGGKTKPVVCGQFTRKNYTLEKFTTYSVLDEKAPPPISVYIPNPREDSLIFDQAAVDENGTVIGGDYYESSWEDDHELINKQRINDGEIRTFSEMVFCKELPFCIYDGNISSSAFALIFPMRAKEEILGESEVTSGTTMCFQAADSEKTYEDMVKILEANHYPAGSLYDIDAQERSDRSMLTFISVFSYGFIILISLISVANVFNTITTNLNLRRREFAMLKTVGMTRKGFKKMLNFECLLYGCKALLYGLPVALFFAWLINQSINFGVTLDFTLPWRAIGISVFCVFFVVFVSMLFSMAKINKDNPIDALKNENL